MRLCGISSHFWLLSPCTGQVTHALLTRPPLSQSSEEDCFVRLACVRHAASVHPEPGSNSQIKCWCLNLASCLASVLPSDPWDPQVFRFKLSFVPWTRCPDITLPAGPNVFRGFRPCSLNWTFEVVLLFSCQAALLSADSTIISVQLANFLILTDSFQKVKTFLSYFLNMSCCQYSFIFHFDSHQDPKKAKNKNGEGGIWTLAPRKRSTPLAGAPLQPLEYFS